MNTPPNQGNKNTFRFNARNIFLTYSTIERFTSTDPVSFQSAVATILRSFGSCTGVVAIEQHANGEHHIHACARFSRKLDICRPDAFDVFNVHPNIQPARKFDAVLTYCKKDKNFIEISSDEPVESILPEINYFSLARECSFEQWINHCIQLKLQHGYAMEIWKYIKNISACTIREEDIIIGSMDERLTNYTNDFNKPLLIIGKPGCGKTTWAKVHAPKPCLFVSHFDVLREFDNHASIIFDDMDFQHLPRQAQIHIVDTENVRAIHRRYGITIIPPGTTKIFTANHYPFIEDDAIKRRINVVKIY